MKLYHFSAKPLVGDMRVIEQEKKVLFHMKPRGLWVTPDCEDSWEEWCRSEDFGLSALAIKTEVVLRPNANILTISGAAALDAFDRKWGIAAAGWPRAIKWEAVAHQYDGILIAPYVWERRLTVYWYYGWDCASGCIWNPRAIESLQDATDTKKEPASPCEGERASGG